MARKPWPRATAPCTRALQCSLVATKLSNRSQHYVVYYLSYCSLTLFTDTVHMGFPNLVSDLMGPRKKKTPENWGVIAWYQSLGTRIPRTRWGTGLDHTSIVHFDELMCVICA